ncbi:MAG: tetratricopeptide repeat protein, partial [bacterium]
LYHVIRVDSLPPASRPENLYKEAWALLQANTQTGDQVAEATAVLTRFLEAYPDEERAPATLAQRALLKQQQKDFAGAIADFTLLQERYPKAAERELAFQQKALLLGQQQQNKEMVEAFIQLLQEYPKSQAAPQAHYWIGWTALDNKDYESAVSELAQARTGDPKQFSERAGLRILLAQYYLNHPAEAAREAAALKPALIPPEVGRWLGLQAMESGDPAKAERFLSPLVRDGLPGATDQEIQNTLAASLTTQGKFREAQAPAAACLKLAHDPASRAKALLVAATIQRSIKNSGDASSMIEEAMLLQPEGSINAEARILSGDLLSSRQDYASAAKAYMTVAVLYDDPVLTPKALTRAVDAYRKAGNPNEAQKTSEELRKRFPNGSVPAAPVTPKTTKTP